MPATICGPMYGHLIYVRACGPSLCQPEISAKADARRAGAARPRLLRPSTPIIETGAPDLLWMNHHAFIGNARSEPGIQNLRFFVVDYGGPSAN